MEKEEKKKSKKKVFIAIGISIAVIAIVVAIILIFFVPKVKVIGSNNMTINLNANYKDKGATAKYQGKDVTSSIKTTGKVNTSKIGSYEITYTIKKGIFTTKKKRTVTVVDKVKPEIVLEGEEEIKICPAKEYEEVGFTATDNYDGDITKKVKTTIKDDVVIYTAIDSSGNKSVVKRIITREDAEKPVITLKGTNPVYITRGGAYNESGFTVKDNCDDDLESKVQISGTVDTSNIGSSTITYKVVDNGGNEVSVTRTVYVVSPQASVPNGIYKNSMIYLTFDDGPSNVTSEILDILKQKGVKATFFVINKSDDLNSLIQREHNEGHTVALHSYTHDYGYVYSSYDNYFKDLNAISNKVKNITGIEPKIVRFPGGGSNTISRNYATGIMKVLTNEVLARGYHYFDWNVDCNDAGGARTKEQVYNNVVSYLSHNQTNVVLMHDFQDNYKTVQALGSIIDFGLSNGYTFAAIDMDTPMVRHRVNN